MGPRQIVEPYRGKIVYLDIWGTWCSPCKRKLSVHGSLSSGEGQGWGLKAELKDYDIVYLYLANQSPEKSWKNVIAEYNLTDPNCVHYNLPDDQQQAVEQYVGLTGFPTYRLFDKQGRIHHLNWLDDENLSEFKKKLDFPALGTFHLVERTIQRSFTKAFCLAFPPPPSGGDGGGLVIGSRLQQLAGQPNGQWSTFNGQWSMVNVQWSMVKGLPAFFRRTFSLAYTSMLSAKGSTRTFFTKSSINE